MIVITPSVFEAKVIETNPEMSDALTHVLRS